MLNEPKIGGTTAAAAALPAAIATAALNPELPATLATSALANPQKTIGTAKGIIETFTEGPPETTVGKGGALAKSGFRQLQEHVHQKAKQYE